MWTVVDRPARPPPPQKTNTRRLGAPENHPTPRAERRSSGGLDPGHHLAQLGADLLDRVGGPFLLQLGEVRAARFVLGDPLAGERAVLDLREHLAHLLLDLRSDDPRATGEVAVLRGVGHRVALPGDAAL